MDIIKISWNEHFAVGHDFDLNQLRKLVRVKELKRNHYEISEDAAGIEVEIGSILEPQQVAEQTKSEEYKKESQQRYELYQNEKNRADKLQKELECLKMQISTEDTDNENKDNHDVDKDEAAF